MKFTEWDGVASRGIMIMAAHLSDEYLPSPRINGARDLAVVACMYHRDKGYWSWVTISSTIKKEFFKSLLDKEATISKPNGTMYAGVWYKVELSPQQNIL